MTKKQRTYNGESLLSSINGVGKTGQIHAKKKRKMAILNPSLTIITLNVSELNSLIKRHRVAEWI